MPKKTPKPEEVTPETPAAVEPQAEAQVAAEVAPPTEEAAKQPETPAAPLPTIAAAAIKAREEKGGIVLRWREEGQTIKADGMIEDAGVIVKRTYEITIQEGADLQRETQVGVALMTMDAHERSHALAGFKKYPHIMDEAEHSILLRKAAKGRLEDLRERMEATKSDAANAKKAYEAAQEEFVAKAKEDCVPDLYRVAASATAATEKPEAAAETAQPAAEPAPVVNDAWREVKLDELIAHGAPKGIIAKLCDRSPAIDTLGKLSDYMNAKGQWWAKDLKCGCGPEKAQLISDAFSGWFFANPEKGGGIQGAEAKPEAAAEVATDDGNETEVGGSGDELPAGEDLDQDTDQPEFADDDAPTDEPTDAPEVDDTGDE